MSRPSVHRLGVGQERVVRPVVAVNLVHLRDLDVMLYRNVLSWQTSARRCRRCRHRGRCLGRSLGRWSKSRGRCLGRRLRR
eukprot:6087597-Pyramimonas_sp.AAC.1